MQAEVDPQLLAFRQGDGTQIDRLRQCQKQKKPANTNKTPLRKLGPTNQPPHPVPLPKKIRINSNRLPVAEKPAARRGERLGENRREQAEEACVAGPRRAAVRGLGERHAGVAAFNQTRSNCAS